VSNYDWERLRGFEKQVLVGAEIVNGRGDVWLKVFDDETDQASSYIHLRMTPDQALDFAKLLSRQAHEAMRAKWDEANILSG
jgi:hypothetical protein